MRVSTVSISGFRSFERHAHLELGSITVLVGPNNAGKSSVLRALHLMQDGGGPSMADVRSGAKNADITIGLEHFEADAVTQYGTFVNGRATLHLTVESFDRRNGNVTRKFLTGSSQRTLANAIPATDPHHFVVPYLSKRKPPGYQEDVRYQFAMLIASDLSYLSAKLSRISNPSFPGYRGYTEACEAILGFVVTTVPSESGQRAGVYLPNRDTVTIDQMGEGVPNIVGLLADLALSEGKLFLIEEPENDLHPEALKALLVLIAESSKKNQFVVSTHSNIVLRHLGALDDSRVYHISAPKGQLPTTAKIVEVEKTPQARLDVLRELGYSFSDFDLWDGWLILEESSAERIIRDYLIPLFAPRLSRVRTLAANGTGEVEATFDDFHRLVRFTHLEQAYANAAWVRVDADPSGRAIVDKLRERYPSWSQDRFRFFEQEQFERYYPEHFAERVEATLAIANKKDKREAKRALLNDVRAWLDEDLERARAALSVSAKEIIDDLRNIEVQLLGR
ncbi:ATP-dependent endonuclease [Paraburkholderia phenoliruptrix]|uniref:ATP-dependent endonuclease n=1 Tax=Paraburkholderia phenoliruptrix TaxID=252970 RepID=UPI0034CE973B